MAGIYNSDIHCNDCMEYIKRRIASGILAGADDTGLWELIEYSADDSIDDIVGQLDQLEEDCYDSNEYPKWCPDDAESDSPQHCGSGADCINAEYLGVWRVGYCFGNSLTSDGEEYVKRAVREGGEVAELWAVQYDYLDFEEDDDHDES